MELIAKDIVAGYGAGPSVVQGVSLMAQPGTVTTLLGPNGCGKSTFLKTLSRVLSPRSGSVTVDGSLVHDMAPREASRIIGMLAQQPIAPAGITVSDLVARGRHPYRSLFGGLSATDKEAISTAMEMAGVTSLATAPVADLSGGQRQRVWFAMVLAQDTPIILLDEPTTYLDPAHALMVLDLAREQALLGKTVIAVLHDLQLAGTYSDQLILMKSGEVVASGAPASVLTPSNLASVYGLRAEVWEDPSSDSPVIVPRGVV